AEFTTWLHRVTVNAALVHCRKAARRMEHPIGVPLGFLFEGSTCAGPRRPRPAAGPECQVLAHETQRLIEEAMAGVPRLYREVYLRVDVQGLTNAEVAARLGLRLAAVKSRLHRARLLLRAELAPHFEEMNAHRPPGR